MAGTLPPSQGGVTSSPIQKLICRKERFITDFRNINKGSLEWIKLSLFTFV